MRANFWGSLSFRLALAYTALLCISMGILLGVYYWIAVERPLRQIQDEVSREAQTLAQLYIVDGREALIGALERRRAAIGARKAFDAFISPDGRLVSGNLPSWPATPARSAFHIEADIYRGGGELDFNALSRDRVFQDGARLIVGRDVEDLTDRNEVVLTSLSWIFGLTLLLGVSGGFLMSRAIGQRLELISSAARKVIAGDLGGRVAIQGSGDDFDRMARILNAMLARNQDLLEAVRRVSDNVAHELRTPLARLIARLEVLEQTCPGMGERTEVEAALAEANRLQSIFNALLRISRIEEGRHDRDFRMVDLSILATDAFELYRPIADSKGIELKIETVPNASVRADPDLLFQVAANLLDNAVKFTPHGGMVNISARREKDEVVLTVSDSGPGLLPGESDRMTERFFRGHASQGVEGEGLGLSLVAAIAKLHGARLVATSNQPGLSLSVRLEAKAKE